MQKRSFVITILLFIILTGHGQTNIYHPFPDSNAFWGDNGTNIFYFTRFDTRYGLNGDTIINGKNYSKVYSLYDSTLINPNSTYFAAIREQDKRIYTVIGSNPEEVLYDFNLRVGDTITHHYSLFDMEPEIFSCAVTQIDSFPLYNGEYRKRFSFGQIEGSFTMPDTVVEGIGSICARGLFNPLYNNGFTNGDIYRFECFKQNETIIFLHNLTCDHCFCTLNTGIKQIAGQEKLTISPNPFSHQTVLQTNIFLKNASLFVYNSFGQQIRQVINISGYTITLNRENLPVGIYLLRITENNRIITTDKLIISNN